MWAKIRKNLFDVNNLEKVFKVGPVKYGANVMVRICFKRYCMTVNIYILKLQ